MDEQIDAQVVYALPHEQRLFAVRLAPGATVRMAVEASGVLQRYPEVSLDSCKLGIFGERVDEDRQVAAGDRIEVYRGLIADPKESRRRRAQRAAR